MPVRATRGRLRRPRSRLIGVERERSAHLRRAALVVDLIGIAITRNGRDSRRCNRCGVGLDDWSRLFARTRYSRRSAPTGLGFGMVAPASRRAAASRRSSAAAGKSTAAPAAVTAAFEGEASRCRIVLGIELEFDAVAGVIEIQAETRSKIFSESFAWNPDP